MDGRLPWVVKANKIHPVAVSLRGMGRWIPGAFVWLGPLLAWTQAVPDPGRDTGDLVSVVSSRPSRSSVRPGEVFDVAVRIHVKKGWHVYPANPVRGNLGKPTRFVLEGPVELRGKIREPQPHKDASYGPDLVQWVHEGEVRFVLPVAVRPRTRPGRHEIRGRAELYVCSTVCLDRTVDFRFPIEVLPPKAPAEEEGSEASPAPMPGDLQEAEPIRSVSAETSAGTVKRNEVFEVRIRVALGRGWHIYPANPIKGNLGKPTRFEFDGPVRVAGKVREPEAELDESLGPGMRQWVHRREVVFTVPLVVKGNAEPGKRRIRGKVHLYACSTVCLDRTEEFDFEIRILPGRVAPPPSAGETRKAPEPAAGAGKGSPGGSGEEPAPAGNTFLGFLALCAVGGLLSLIQPCVYPMIPVTVTYFVKQGAGHRARSAAMAWAYAAGIVVTFTVLGLVLSVAMGRGGANKFAQNPWVNLTIAAVFVAFALSLLGVFELRLPSFLTQGAGRQRTGVFGAFVLGLAFTVVTFTCTIPIAAMVLGVAALGNFGWALPGMLVYSLTMALPFMLLGIFPGLLGRIPRSGGWLNEAKVCGGLLEMAIALMYFVRADWGFGNRWLTRDFGIVFWSVCMGLAGIYLLGMVRWKGDSPVERVGVLRAAFASIFLGVALYFYSGMGSRPLGVLDGLLPRDPVVDEGGRFAVLEKRIERLEAGGIGGGARIPPQRWLTDLAEAEALARRSGWPLFIDFTGFT